MITLTAQWGDVATGGWILEVMVGGSLPDPCAYPHGLETGQRFPLERAQARRDMFGGIQRWHDGRDKGHKIRLSRVRYDQAFDLGRLVYRAGGRRSAELGQQQRRDDRIIGVDEDQPREKKRSNVGQPAQN